MTRSDQHSDLGVGLLYLLGGASIVLLIFAWAVSYSIYLRTTDSADSRPIDLRSHSAGGSIPR